MDDFQRHLSKFQSAERVIMTGTVSDQELIWLYRNCYAHIYPSLFEGFGLPVLKGMQFSAPTLVSLSTSIPEVAGDAAIQRHRPDEIYNLASQSAPAASWMQALETGEITGLGAHRVIEAARRFKPDCRV